MKNRYLTFIFTLSAVSMWSSNAFAEVDFNNAYDVAKGSVTGVSALDAQDINGDGYIDIVAMDGGKHSGGDITFAWFESPDSDSSEWIRHDLKQPSTFRPFIGAVRIGDIDKDGDNDIVVVMDNHSNTTRSAYIYWLENPMPAADTAGDWAIHTVAANIDVHHINDMELADLDGDGDLDVACRALEPNQLHLFFNNSLDWTERVIGTSQIHSTGEGMAVGDLDLDGQMDITVSGYWFKGPSNPQTGTYTQYTIDATYAVQNGNTKEAIGFINDDAYPDVIISPAEGYRGGKKHDLIWYEGSADPTSTSAWTPHIIEDYVNGRHTVILSDVDADNDLDVISGTAWEMWGQTMKVEVYYNDGDGEFGTKQVVASGRGLYSGVARDLGNDGDIDIIGQETYSGQSKPYIYESNLNEHVVQVQEPVISPTGDTFGGSVSVTITSADQNTVIYYSLDGSTPTTSSTRYSGSIELDASAEVKAIAFRDGYLESGVVSTSYIIDSTGPELDSTTADDLGQELVVSFSEDLNASAATTDMFSVSGGVTVTSVNIEGDKAYLDVSDLTPGTEYILTVSDISDVYGNTATDTQELSFTYGEAAVNDLLHHWTFDGITSSTVPNSAEGGNDGTLVNATVVDGAIGKALNFAGNAYVDVGAVAPSSTNKLSIALWINANNFEDSEARIISQATGTDSTEHNFMISTYESDGPKLRFRLKVADRVQTLVANDGALAANNWVHVAVTYDGSLMRIFKDGDLVGSQNATGELDASFSGSTNIGRNPVGGRYFNGLIDDVRFYSKALTEAEIDQLIQEADIEVSPPQPPSGIQINVL